MSAAFVRWTGLALCLAALLTIGINSVLTPMLPTGQFSELAASHVFLLRQSLASAAALLMLFGIVGLHASRAGSGGVFANVAFAVALTGAAALFSVEWNQVFTIRDLAHFAPTTLDGLEDQAGLTPFDIGAIAGASTFFLGWLLLAISLLFSRQYSKISAALVLIGFIVAPILSATGVNGAWAAAASSVVIGSGWLLLGYQMMRSNVSRPAA